MGLYKVTCLKLVPTANTTQRGKSFGGFFTETSSWIVLSLRTLSALLVHFPHPNPPPKLPQSGFILET